MKSDEKRRENIGRVGGDFRKRIKVIGNQINYDLNAKFKEILFLLASDPTESSGLWLMTWAGGIYKPFYKYLKKNLLNKSKCASWLWQTFSLQVYSQKHVYRFSQRKKITY